MSLKEKILSNMPDGLDDLGKARYLYIELGKHLSFSTKFRNTDQVSELKFFSVKVDINTFNQNQVNCVMWAQLYSQLLTEVNIKHTLVKQGHSWVVFEVDGVKWKADATEGEYTDLSRIHNSDYTCYFGPITNQDRDVNKTNSIWFNEKNRKRLLEIDDKLGYNSSKKKKLMELMNLLLDIRNGNLNIRELLPDIEITSENEVFVKLEYLFAKLEVMNDGYYESKDFVFYLEDMLLTEKELLNVKAIELKRTNSQKEVDIIQCIYAINGTQINYYLLAPNQPIRKVRPDEIVRLAALGYGIDEKSIPGIDFPKKFKPGKISTNLRYRIEKKFVPRELIMYDEVQSKTI